MPFLSLIHLGDLGKLTAIPNLSRLVRLKYLILAVLSFVKQVPGLDALTNLEQLLIIFADRLESLPSRGALSKLTTAVAFGLGSMCCNGFLLDKCDLTQPACIHQAACSSTTASLADQTRLHATLACRHPMTVSERPTIESADLACGGVAYKQCKNNDEPGICYPIRMQLVGCQVDATLESMRQLQIQRGVGQPCDPDVEKWLGCIAK